VYRCPSAPEGTTQTHYVAVVGAGAGFEEIGPLHRADFADNRGRTVIVVEAVDAAIPWTAPRDITIEEFQAGLGRTNGASSAHHGGMNAVFAGGYVEFLNLKTNVNELRALSTRTGND
jgi:hypothetical protein